MTTFAPLPAAQPGATVRQDELRDRAESLFPGGVNSPVRAFRSVGRAPLILEAGEGARVRDVDGRWYLDYIGSWGPGILGHAVPSVVVAVVDAALDGLPWARHLPARSSSASGSATRCRRWSDSASSRPAPRPS